MEIMAEQPHREPAELDHHVVTFRYFLDRSLPDRKQFLAAVGIDADADRAAAMIEHDPGVRKGTREIGEFADLRVKQPRVETQAQGSETGKSLAKGRIEQ